MIAIKKGTLDDAEILSRINVQTWKAAFSDILPGFYLNSLEDKNRTQYFRKEILNKTSMIDLIYQDNKPVGYINYIFHCMQGEIKQLYVLKEFWSKQYGYTLLKNTIDKMKRNGIDKYFIWVLKDNIRALKFYTYFNCEYLGQNKFIEIHKKKYLAIKLEGKL